MKKTINQIELLLYEINKTLDLLLSSTLMDGKYIAEITQLLIQNKSLSKEVNDILVQRSLKERSSTNKLRLLYVIDSLIKHFGKEFIQHISPHIFRIFEEAYTLADEENKINLFKLYYSWKYFLDSALIESICSRFNFSKMKRDLQRDKPELIEKYDKYNETVRETLMKDAGNLGTGISSTTPSSNILSSTNSNAITGSSNMPITNSAATTTNSSNFEIKDLKKSFLKDIASSSMKSKARKGEVYLSDSLFSSHSSSPVISSDHDESSYLRRKLHHPNKNKEMKSNKSYSHSDHQTSKSSNSSNEKQKKTVSDSKIQKQQNSMLPKQISKDEASLPSEPNPSRIDQYPVLTPQANPSATMQPINFQMINQQLLNWMHSGMRNISNIPNIQNFQLPSNFQQMQNMQNLPDYIKNNVLFQNLIKANKQQQAVQMTKISPVNSFYDALNSFIITSQIKPSTNTNLFSSISKFFYDTLQENNPIKDITKEDKEIKNKLDILKIKDFNSKESYKDLYKKLIDSLYSDITNCCPMCGFRTKIYTKFLEHLDIHFYVNYIKRNSQKKVLYRRESSDKQNWIKGLTQTGEVSLTDHSNIFNQPSCMLNAVMFYQNDNYQQISNTKISKISDNPEDNEQLIVPVQPDDEIYCVYCGEEFKKKYMQKFHYWFYVNVVKLSSEEVKNYKEIADNLDQNLQKNGYVLIHETCIEEFFNMVKTKESINAKEEKRNRE